MSRLQLLTTKFENIKMKEDETIHEFCMNVREISNNSGALGEKLTEEKLVRKILRSLPKRLDMKVTAIEEAQDINNMKMDELIGTLQIFESSICEPVEKKNKSIAFVTNTGDDLRKSNGGSNENLSEAIAMLGKQFNSLIKRVDQQSKSNVKNTSNDIIQTYDSSKDSKLKK